MPDRKFLLSLLLSGILIVASQSGRPQSPALLQQIDEFLISMRYEEALELARANLDLYEGDTNFDFLYALASLESGNAAESVFAFERVIATSADPVLRERAKLELARAHFAVNNLNASEELFAQVLATAPPANVRENIEAYLRIIDGKKMSRQKNWRWTVSSYLGSDDNINSATNDSLINTPLIGLIELSPDGKQTADEFSSTLLTVQYLKQYTHNSSLEFFSSLNHLDNFHTSQFDIDNITSGLAYNWGNARHQLSHGLSISKISLDGEAFQLATGLNSEWQRTGSNGWYQSLDASYFQIRYDNSNSNTYSDLRDIDQFLIAGGIGKQSERFTHSLNLYHANEKAKNSAEGKHNGRRFTGFSYNLFYQLNARHTPFLRLSIQETRHASEHPIFFDTVREDSTENIGTGWLWQLDQHFILSAEASFADNDSNIQLFDYDRFRYRIGVRYLF